MWGVPPVLILEPTTFCQLHCPLCIRESKDFKRSNKHMNIKLVEKLLRECGSRLCVVILHNQGEPFLHPEIIKIIELFRKYDIIVKISTNGNYKEDISKAIVRSGLDHIIFDIDGDTQEVYEKYRIGGSLDVVLSNLKKLSEAKKEYNSRTPFIDARVIAMKHNIERIDYIKRLLDNYDIDLFTIKKSVIRDEDEFEGAMSFIPDVFQRDRYKVPQSCHYPWINFCVLVNGEVSPCCYDEKGELILGDIQKDSIRSILNNSSYIKMRQLMKNNPMKVPMCAKCDISGDNYILFNEFKKLEKPANIAS